MLMAVNRLFNSAMGPVEQATVTKALELMLYGMISIFIVMALIYGVICLLNTVTGKKKKDAGKK